MKWLKFPSGGQIVNVDEYLLKTKPEGELYASRATVRNQSAQHVGDRTQTIGTWVVFINAAGGVDFSALVLKAKGGKVAVRIKLCAMQKYLLKKIWKIERTIRNQNLSRKQFYLFIFALF